MSNRLEVLSSYVSTLALQRLKKKPAPLTNAHAQEFQAAVLFADLSGFTMLADRLAHHHGIGIPHGAEELAHLLNLYFGQLIEIIYEHGGDVTEFAGDALLAVWAVNDPSELNVAVTKAAQCALTAQACLNNYPVATDIPLSLRIGIGAGTVTAMHVGGAAGHWKIFMSGLPVIQAILAQQQAEPGRVVLSAETRDLMRDNYTGSLLPDGSLTLWAVRTLPPTSSPQRELLDVEAEIGLLSYLPGAIVLRLLSNYQDAEWLAELRYVTVLFINLPSLNESSNVEAIQQVVRSLQTVLYRYECSVNKVCLGETGLVVVGALGLPPLAHEDDALRALHAAFSLQDELAALHVNCFIGITSGMAFCGSVGTEVRREYTLIGDVVNVASRLMRLAFHLQAPTEHSVILCDSATYQSTVTRISFQTIPSVSLKGKALPLEVHRALRDQPPSTPTHPITRDETDQIVGRESEITLVQHRLRHLQQKGVGGTIIFEGESGIGKSRLLEEAKRFAEGTPLSIFTLVGDPLERSTPYRAWRTAFSRLLDLDVLSASAERQAHVQSLMEIWQDRALDQLVPLLNVVLPLELPDNDTTRPLNGLARAEATAHLLCEILRISANSSPKVFLIEDAHWLDNNSWALILKIAHSTAHQKILFIIALRPFAEEAAPADYLALSELPATVQIHLHPLPTPEALTLACHQWGVKSLSPAVANLILQTTEGNPFYIAELTYALRDSGLITIQNGECRAVHGAVSLNYLHFPNTIQGVITSRIDRLPPPQQLTLKVASLIGREFTFNVLREVYPVREDLPRLPDYLHEMERLELIKPDPEAPELTYAFKHTITQEVTYGLMLFSQRRDLHRQIGLVIEQLHSDRLSEVHGILGRHFLRGENWEKAYHYLAQAGDAAVRLNAEAEARFYYAQALESLKHLASSAQNHRHFREMVLKFTTLAWSVTPLTRTLELLHTAESLARLLPTTALLNNEDIQAAFQNEFWIARLQLYSNDSASAVKRLTLLMPRLQKLGDPALLIECQIYLGQALIGQGKFTEAAAPLTAAQTLLTESASQDEVQPRQVMALKGVVAAALKQPDSGCAPEDATARMAAPLQWFDAAFIHTYEGLSAALNNDFAALLKSANTVIDLAYKADNPFYLYLGYNLCGWGEMLVGDIVKAQESFRLAQGAGKGLGETLLFGHWFAQVRTNNFLPLISITNDSKEQLLGLAHAEVLTNTHPQHSLFELAKHEFDVASRYQNPLTVIVFELDHVKQNTGGPFGQTVYKQLSESLTQASRAGLRSVDILGRYSEGKFIALLPMTDAKNAYIVAERIRLNAAAIKSETIREVTLSVGVAEVQLAPVDESVGNVIKRASEALALAKTSGGNQTVIFERETEF